MAQWPDDYPTQDQICFLLDGRIHRVSSVPTDRTLLHYLRETLLRTGTKEGCAEGDCGACTVVVAEEVDGRLRFQAVNACIQLLGMLHGKALFTVESLQPEGSAQLHPVQQAMVDHHASQCGFCTPGFVMSLFALYKTVANPSREQVEDALSGNLCRCTGYRPIIEAALSIQKDVVGDVDSVLMQSAVDRTHQAGADERQLLDQLQQLKSDRPLLLEHQGQRFFQPRTSEQLSQWLQAYPDSTLVAGNTDVGLWINKQLREIENLVHLGRVNELQQLSIDATGLTIGAAVSLSDACAEIIRQFPALSELYRRFASMPVRNAGTLVGNVANGSPIGDSMPALLVLDAEVLLCQDQQQRILPLSRFYLGYQQKDLRAGEFVEALRIQLADPPQHLASYKISKRYDQDISAVCAAFALSLDEQGRVSHVRIAFGGMAAIPARAAQTEQALINQTWNEAVVGQAMNMLAEDFSPLSDLRASADYRLRVAQNLLYRFFLETRAQPEQVPVTLDALAS